MEQITSLTNAKVKYWVRLHQKKERDVEGVFLIEGEHLIQEARRAGIVESIITDDPAMETKEPMFFVTEAIMKKISDNVSRVHQIAICRQIKPCITKLDRVLLLDGVQDPGNLGTLIRTAVSFGFDAVVLSKDCCDLYNEKTIRSTQGAMFHIPVARMELKNYVQELQENGVCVVATALDASIPMQDVEEKEKMAFILGNEGQGVRPVLQKNSDLRVRIEMSGFESLNVAVAGGILMYRFRRS